MGVVGETGTSGWNASDVVSRFATTGFSDAGEALALEAVADQVRGDVLDLGVGGGRTTGLLAAAARSYVGVDLSPEMVALARSRHPGADLRTGDAVDLGGLDDAAYDHADRAAALASMARVTRPGGRVLFSSLNLDGVSFDERPWRVAGGLLSPRVRYHVAHAARHPSTVVRSLRHYRRTREQTEDGQGWGRRPLRAHEFRFVVHFATVEETVAEARAAGLEVVAAYADDGRGLPVGTARSDADYVHFVCRPAQG